MSLEKNSCYFNVFQLVILLCFIILSKGAELGEKAFKTLPVGRVTPHGWLKTQLTLQSEGS